MANLTLTCRFTCAWSAISRVADVYLDILNANREYISNHPVAIDTPRFTVPLSGPFFRRPQ